MTALLVVALTLMVVGFVLAATLGRATTPRRRYASSGDGSTFVDGGGSGCGPGDGGGCGDGGGGGGGGD
jgi:hypothetical protein